MKLDVDHEIVPSELVERIAALKHGGTYKVMKNLLKHKLLHHDASKYDGFRLTYLGYDFLAIKTLVNRGVFSAVGRQLGVGKESDIFEVATEDGTVLAMKLHRLGRTSFRAVKSKRDYLKHRSSFNWLYLSRLAALREFSFMKALEEHGFPVPNAVDCNRHCVIMSLVQGYPLVQVKKLENPEIVFNTIIGLVVRLAEHGLIHCDFNEFNIMIDDDEKVTMIDFPQMVSVSHRNAQMYFDRDVECVFKFFSKRFNLSFHECTADIDGTAVDTDDSGRPSFTSIAKDTGFRTRNLLPVGLLGRIRKKLLSLLKEGSRRMLVLMMKILKMTKTSVLNEENMKGVESLHVVDQTLKHDEEGELEGNLRTCEAGPSSEHEAGSDEVRRRAITAARGGRKTFASRNTYKDKGGKSSNSSKIQRQLGSW
ncbi:hypothetical protein M0R45_001558 [Rubus argutus]|uniref:non-specific serine/threonine protein kinase n=1 Tax=Rubus argutus TaxID=59490 RepID=A0AAW1VG93_RUBAR